MLLVLMCVIELAALILIMFFHMKYKNGNTLTVINIAWLLISIATPLIIVKIIIPPIAKKLDN